MVYPHLLGPSTTFKSLPEFFSYIGEFSSSVICKPPFLAQYLFGCTIKSTHLGDVPRAKSWDLGAYTVPWGVI